MAGVVTSITTADGIVTAASGVDKAANTSKAFGVNAAGTLGFYDASGLGGGFQPLDATLTAFAALTIAANTITIGTGADAFSQTSFAANTFPARASTGNLEAKTITDAALSILDDATVGAILTTIGGQPLDAELTAIAGLTSAANKVPYFTGSGTAALADLTADARTLIDNTVALGDLAYGSATNVWSQLAGNTTATQKFLAQTGNGSVSAAPTWEAISGTLPSIGPDSWKIRSDGTDPSYQPTDRLFARAASTTNINVSSPGATIGGVSMSTGNRAFLGGQTAAAENGLWVWYGAATPMTRPTDYPSGGVFDLS